MQRDVELVEQFYAALSKRNVKAMLMLMSKDVEIVQSPELPWGGVYRGHEGAQEYWGKLEEYLDSRVEIECCIDAGDHVVAVGRTTGKGRSSKLEFDIPVVHVWAVQGGQITRFEPYLDNATMLAALNL